MRTLKRPTVPWMDIRLQCKIELKIKPGYGWTTFEKVFQGSIRNGNPM
jgi:hypothetical protein